MYFIVWKFKNSKYWALWDLVPYKTHDEANDIVLGLIKIDQKGNVDAEYCITKVWTTYKAYGA